MLDPAVVRIVLFERTACHGHFPTREVKEDGPGRGGTLVQGQDQPVSHLAHFPRRLHPFTRTRLEPRASRNHVFIGSR